MTSQGDAVSKFAWAVKTANPNIAVPAAAGREALHSLATQRRLIEVCRALDEWEPPEL